LGSAGVAGTMRSYVALAPMSRRKSEEKYEGGLLPDTASAWPSDRPALAMVKRSFGKIVFAVLSVSCMEGLGIAGGVAGRSSRNCQAPLVRSTFCGEAFASSI